MIKNENITKFLTAICRKQYAFPVQFGGHWNSERILQHYYPSPILAEVCACWLVAGVYFIHCLSGFYSEKWEREADMLQKGNLNHGKIVNIKTKLKITWPWLH